MLRISRGKETLTIKGDHLETNFLVKWRLFGDHFEGNWRPLVKLSVILSIIGSNRIQLTKMTLIFQNLPISSQFLIFLKHTDTN